MFKAILIFMSKVNMRQKGREYEKLVEHVIRLISEQNEFDEIKRNAWLDTKHGQVEIDILLIKRGSLYDFKTLIECKDLRAKVGIGVIVTAHSKMIDSKCHNCLVVSKSGFSSKAVSKAKELNISLFRADEIESKAFSISPMMPVVLKEFRVIGKGTDFIIDLNKEENPELIPRNESILKVNDKSIFDWLKEKWNIRAFGLHQDISSINFSFDELAEKYIRNIHGEKMYLNDFKIKVQLDVKLHFGYLNMNAQGYIMEEIIKGETQVILPINEKGEEILSLRRISKLEFAQLEHVELFALIVHDI
jgi:hypothetical protein